VLSPDPLVHSLNFVCYEENQKTKKRTLMTLNQQMKKISQWTTTLISCAVQYRKSNKKLHART